MCHAEERDPPTQHRQQSKQKCITKKGVGATLGPENDLFVNKHEVNSQCRGTTTDSLIQMPCCCLYLTEVQIPGLAVCASQQSVQFVPCCLVQPLYIVGNIYIYP